MAKSQPESTTESTASQANSAVKPSLLKASVYAKMSGLTKFDSAYFLRVAEIKAPGAYKSIADWDAIRKEALTGNTATKK